MFFLLTEWLKITEFYNKLIYYILFINVIIYLLSSVPSTLPFKSLGPVIFFKKLIGLPPTKDIPSRLTLLHFSD